MAEYVSKAAFENGLREALESKDSPEVNRLIVGYLESVREDHREEAIEIEERLKESMKKVESVENHQVAALHMDEINTEYYEYMGSLEDYTWSCERLWGEKVAGLTEHPDIILDAETCDLIHTNAHRLPGRPEEGMSPEEVAILIRDELGPPRVNLAQEYAQRLKDSEAARSQRVADGPEF